MAVYVDALGRSPADFNPRYRFKADRYCLAIADTFEELNTALIAEGLPKARFMFQGSPCALVNALGRAKLVAAGALSVSNADLESQAAELFKVRRRRIRPSPVGLVYIGSSEDP